MPSAARSSSSAFCKLYCQPEQRTPSLGRGIVESASPLPFAAVRAASRLPHLTSGASAGGGAAVHGFVLGAAGAGGQQMNSIVSISCRAAVFWRSGASVLVSFPEASDQFRGCFRAFRVLRVRIAWAQAVRPLGGGAFAAPPDGYMSLFTIWSG
jgi:hypothetical protein